MLNECIPAYNDFAEVALRRYPELAGADIRIKSVKKGIFPYFCRPDIFSLFFKKSSRRYYIFISEKVNDGEEDVLFANLTDEAKTGILGHEIAHVVYYENSSFFKLLLVGMLYFLPPFRKNFERDTDKTCIRHGLGKHLLHYAEFVHDFISRTGKLQWVKKYYLSPEEIEYELENLPSCT
jgi:hypothetical protein